jgi:tetratricopeptide (TPR) repeat protein
VACLHNLANYLMALGQRADAEPILRRVLEAWDGRAGPKHPHVAACLNELAELARRERRFDEAEPLYRRAIAIAEAAYRGDHPHLASYLNNLALTLGAAGQADQAVEAEQLFSRALSIDVDAFGQDHPKVANRLSNLAWLLCRTGRAEKAEPVARRAVEILMTFRAQTARNHTSWESTWNQYVELLVDLGDDKEAIQKRYNAIVQTVNQETLRAD